jgi:hypothetical protein
MMMLRCLIALLAVAVVVLDAEAGPFRRRGYTANSNQSYVPATVSPVMPTSSPGSTVIQVSASTPAGGAASAAPGDGLDEVNAQRAARGLRPFLRDDNLTRAAQDCAAFRAQRGIFGHTSNDFAFVPAGSFASSAGCAAYPASYGWMSCCVYDNYTYAGAAWVTGADGKRYMHLFVR